MEAPRGYNQTARKGALTEAQEIVQGFFFSFLPYLLGNCIVGGAAKFGSACQGIGSKVNGKDKICGIMPIPSVEDDLIKKGGQRSRVSGFQKDVGIPWERGELLRDRDRGGCSFKQGKGIGEHIERRLANVRAKIVQELAVTALPTAVKGHSQAVIKTYDQLQKRSPSFQQLLYHDSTTLSTFFWRDESKMIQKETQKSIDFWGNICYNFRAEEKAF